MPLVAQVTGAVALTALLMGPWWSRVSTPPPLAAKPITAADATTSTAPAPVAPVTPAAATPDAAQRPAHLNLDVRHTFANIDVVVTVDGKRALDTSLEGSGKKFKMFGRRTERSFTRTIDLQPGVRLVRVNIKSEEDRFDQTRVERFELGEASVASLRITADKSNGLVASVDRPTVVARPGASQAQAPAPAPPPQTAAAAAIHFPSPVTAAPTSASITQQADALAELLNSLRSMLIAIAGFVASAATGFVVQEYLRSKRGALFAGAGAEGQVELDGEAAPAARKDRRRRRSSASHSSAALE